MSFKLFLNYLLCIYDCWCSLTLPVPWVGLQCVIAACLGHTFCTHLQIKITVLLMARYSDVLNPFSSLYLVLFIRGKAESL